MARSEFLMKKIPEKIYVEQATVWYCVAEHCQRRCTFLTDIPEPLIVRAGHCLEFLSVRVRGKAIWKRGVSIEDELKKRK